MDNPVVTCHICHQDFTVPCTDAQYKAWKSGELIQRAMPNVPADERELLISGICGSCFDHMFGGDDE